MPETIPIEAVETAYYRLPLEPMGDAGHGAIDTEELILVTLRAGVSETSSRIPVVKMPCFSSRSR